MNRDELRVTQEDREAAADLLRDIWGGRTTKARKVRAGDRDDDGTVQTFAAHRLRATDDLLEVLERLSKLTPIAANAPTANDFHLTVKAIADSAIARHRGTV